MPYEVYYPPKTIGGTMRGEYIPANFCLPTNTLAAIAASPAAPSAKGAMVKAAANTGMGRARRGMSGQLVPATWTIPPYRSGMSGTGLGFSPLSFSGAGSLISSVPDGYITVAAAAVLFLMMKRGRR